MAFDIDHFHANFVIKYFLKVLIISLSLFTKVINHFHANFVIKCFLKCVEHSIGTVYKSDRPFSVVLELQKNGVV